MTDTHQTWRPGDRVVTPENGMGMVHSIDKWGRVMVEVYDGVDEDAVRKILVNPADLSPFVPAPKVETVIIPKVELDRLRRVEQAAREVMQYVTVEPEAFEDVTYYTTWVRKGEEMTRGNTATGVQNRGREGLAAAVLDLLAALEQGE